MFEQIQNKAFSSKLKKVLFAHLQNNNSSDMKLHHFTKFNAFYHIVSFIPFPPLILMSNVLHSVCKIKQTNQKELIVHT